jgi:hypothetical protein
VLYARMRQATGDSRFASKARRCCRVVLRRWADALDGNVLAGLSIARKPRQCVNTLSQRAQYFELIQTIARPQHESRSLAPEDIRCASGPAARG